MNNINPLLSVIIPVYNTEEYLEKCLESVLNCTYKNLEIIIVDDRSPGNVKELAEKYISLYSNIRLVSNKSNQGLYLSRIIGVEHSKGDYIAFLDSDDYVSIDFYRRLIRKAISSNSDMVMGEIYLEEDGKYKYHNLSHTRVMDIDLYGSDVSKLLFDQEGRDWSLHVVWNKIYRKDLWNKCYEYLKLQDKHLIMCEDVVFSSIFFYFSEHMTNIHGDFVYYVQHSKSSTSCDNMSLQKIRKNLEDINLVFDFITSFFDNLIKDNRYSNNIANWKKFLCKNWNKNIEKSNFKNIDKKILKRIFNDISDSNDDDDYFLSVYTENIYGLRGEEIKKKISDKNIKVVSFDIFDTLIVRPFLEPVDLFNILDVYVNKLLKLTDRINFKEIRIYAENKARENKWRLNPLLEDITLDDIYQEIKELLKLVNQADIDKIKKYEIYLEEKYCYARNYAKELFELAVQLGKRVIITSDMYLPSNVIKNILNKNGYIGYEKLFISSEIKKTKNTGNLFKYISKLMQIDGRYILHIGDNIHSDINKGKEYGWNTFYFPKTYDLLRNRVAWYYGGNVFNDIYHEAFLHRGKDQYKYYSGLSALLGVAANKIFDNPYREFRTDTDFNSDPSIFGYFCMGMHLFSLTHWLIDNIYRNDYSTLIFMARDGYLPMKSFELFNQIYGCEVDVHYLKLTRNVIFPLQINKKEDMYSIPINLNIFTKTPLDILNIFRCFISEENFLEKENILASENIKINDYFSKMDSFFNFIEVFNERFFSEEKFLEYKNKMNSILVKLIKGKTATFDIGYSARIESILSKVFNFNITPYYVHINNDIPLKRSSDLKMNIETFYNYSPGVTGVLRELLISELGPSCESWVISDDNVDYVYKKYNINYIEKYVIENIQKNALDFVSDVLFLFEDDIKTLFYQWQDASLPLEKFLNEAKYYDRLMFKALSFEDDLGEGKSNYNILDFWNGQMNNSRMNTSIIQVGNDLGSIYPLWKRAIFLYFLDRNLLKYKINHRLRAQPKKLKVIKTVYRFLRSIYRSFKLR